MTFTASHFPSLDAIDTRQASIRPRSEAAPVSNSEHLALAGSVESPLVINRLLALLLAAVIVVAFVVLGGDAAAEGPEAEQTNTAHIDSAVVVDKIEVYVVQPGDTLWGIAHDIAAPGQDVNELLHVLKTAAGTADLDIGQRIIVDHSLVGG